MIQGALVPASRLAGALVALVAATAVATALGIAAEVGPEHGFDAQAHVAYAEVLKDDGRLPTEAETYEYATPPAFPWLAVNLERLVETTGEWAGDWRAGQFLSVFWTVAFLAVAWLLARQLWPSRPALAAAALALTAAVPIVFRLGVMFHPEMQFAFLAALGLLLTVRAERRGWLVRDGVCAGVTLGLAALTRPTAAVVITALAFAVLLAARRRALRFAAGATAAIALVAGPWWGYQGARFGNPLQSNLDRYILSEGQPREFYVSAPVEDLVLRPYRPHFAGELWPQFHADLWSDWFGAQHRYWPEPPEGATAVFVSSQSALGLLFAPLALAGLAGFGVASGRRLVRGSPRDGDFARTAFLLLAAASWVAFVVTLVRFPQEGGDPIKSSYMLYLAPVFALSALGVAKRLWERGRTWRFALAAWAVLYAASYAGFLSTSFPEIAR